MVEIKVILSAIEGKAFVACPSSALEQERWIQEDDHFYCDLKSKSSQPQSLHELRKLAPHAIPQCHSCYARSSLATLQKEEILKGSHKLRGLDLFAGKLYILVIVTLLSFTLGAGGLSTGFHLSGYVETKWAVEFSPSAAKTFQ